MDNLVKLENEVQTAFLNGEHLIAVSFDLKNAYDMAWKHGILQTLHNWGLRGHLPTIIGEFMSNRSFSVRLNNILSNSYPQENGVPQGSVLSVTLFAVAINGITKNIHKPVLSSLYVDDYIIYMRGNNKNQTLTRRLQLCVNHIHTWSEETGFLFSPGKAQVIDFHRKRGEIQPPVIFLGEEELPTTKTIRFLGLIFDSKLSWRPHLENLKRRCHQALNILRVLSKTTWGADRKTMLRLYGALIRSKLDYGSMVYNSARPSYLAILNPIHNCGLRLCLGAYRTSPADSLYAESGEPPLDCRRKILGCNYIASMSGQPRHTTYKSVFRPPHQETYAAKPNATRPLGIRSKEFCQLMDITIPPIIPKGTSEIPPWTIPQIQINYNLHIGSKADINVDIQKRLFLEQINLYQDYTQVYTDGSKNNNDVGCAFVTGVDEHGFCLHGASSVYTSEMIALWKALEWVESHHRKDTLLCSDSMSSLQTIGSLFPKHPIAQKFTTL